MAGVTRQQDKDSKHNSPAWTKIFPDFFETGLGENSQVTG
jgi:hypothetical protein